MDKSEVFTLASRLLSESKTAVLSSITPDGQPRMRWMSPVFIRNIENCIYAVTSTGLSKTKDIAGNENVQWMIQNKTLDTIISLNGKVKIIEDQSLKNELLEAIGIQLQNFWKINDDTSSLTVLETEITSALIFYPVKGQKHLVSFEGGQ